MLSDDRRLSINPTPIVLCLIVGNVILFILQLVPALARTLSTFYLVPDVFRRGLLLSLWQALTYMFFHAGPLHLGLNMLILFICGPETETRLGKMEFLLLYLVSGFCAGLCYVATSWGPRAYVPMVGASGAICGVLAAYALLFPRRFITFSCPLFSFTFSARFLVLVFALLEVLSIIRGARDNIAHVAHVTGLLFGYMWIKAGRYILVRALQMIPTLLGISLIGFIIVQIAPGDFATPYRLNPQFSAESIARLEQKYGFDKPLPVQYFRWLRNALQLDFGESTMQAGVKVFDLIATRVMVTLKLSLLVMFVTWLISIPLGIYCAMRQYTFSDKVFSVIAFIGMSIPTFFMAFLLLMLAASVEWLPPGGLMSADYQQLSSWGRILDYLWHMTIPAAVMVLSGVAGLMRIMRGNVLEVKRAQFVVTARAKGLSRRKVIFKHILRNAINPMITIFGYELSALLSGVGLTEAVLAYPGLGELMLRGVLQQDLFLVMGGLMMSSVLLLIGNLIADILLAIADPRIKVG